MSTHTAQAYFAAGLSKYKLGDYAGAIADYDQAITLDPNYTAAYNNRGLAKDHLGDYAAAIADYDQAITLDPNYTAAYGNRGLSKGHLGAYAAAIADFDQAITLDPNYTAAYGNRGNAKYKLGDYAAAIADYDQAIALDPNYTAAYTNRGSAKYELGAYAAAIVDFDQAITLDPNDTAAYHNRGVALQKWQQHRFIESSVQRFVAGRLVTENAKELVERADALVELGQYEEATQSYQKALQMAADDASFDRALVYHNCAIAYEGLGLNESALYHFKIAIDLDEAYALAWYNRGRLYFSLGGAYDPNALDDFLKVRNLDEDGDFEDLEDLITQVRLRLKERL